MNSRSRHSSKTQPERRVKNTRYTKTTRGSDTPGIHNRRDKRFPMANSRVGVDEALRGGTVPEVEHRVDAEHLTAASDEQAAWQEAVMLWLSWNSTYEKLTAKMFRAGTDQQKLEALMDEMDLLRKQAISLSEELIRAV